VFVGKSPTAKNGRQSLGGGDRLPVTFGKPWRQISANFVVADFPNNLPTSDEVQQRGIKK
jgi:hypothetical protein